MTDEAMKLPADPAVEPTTGRYVQWFERQRVAAPNFGESMTDDSFGNDTDINKIVERFARTGYLPEAPSVKPIYDDVTNVQEDLTALLAKTSDARKELENIQKQAQAAKIEQAKKDAEDLERYRAKEAAQASVQPGAEGDNA